MGQANAVVDGPVGGNRQRRIVDGDRSRTEVLVTRCCNRAAIDRQATLEIIGTSQRQRAGPALVQRTSAADRAGQGNVVVAGADRGIGVGQVDVVVDIAAGGHRQRRIVDRDRSRTEVLVTRCFHRAFAYGETAGEGVDPRQRQRARTALVKCARSADRAGQGNVVVARTDRGICMGQVDAVVDVAIGGNRQRGIVDCDRAGAEVLVACSRNGAAGDVQAAGEAVGTLQSQRAVAGFRQAAALAPRVGQVASEGGVEPVGIDRAAGRVDRQVLIDRGVGVRNQGSAVEYGVHVAVGQFLYRARFLDVGRADGNDGGSCRHTVDLNGGEDQRAARTKGFARAVRNQRDAAEAVAVIDGRHEVLFAGNGLVDATHQQGGRTVEQHVDLRRIGGAAVRRRIVNSTARTPVGGEQPGRIDIMRRGQRRVRKK